MANPLVRLRPFTIEELHLYMDWMQDPDVLGPYVEPEQWRLEELLADFSRDQWQSRRLRRWLLIADSDEIMGFAHCWEFDPYEKHVEFGRVQLPAFRGRGLGAPVAEALLDKICEETEAHRIQSMTACSNIAVQHIWKRLGLTVDACLKEYMTLHGNFVDCYVASILRRQWLKRNLSTTSDNSVSSSSFRPTTLNLGKSKGEPQPFGFTQPTISFSPPR